MLAPLPEPHGDLPLYLQPPRATCRTSKIEELACARLRRLCRNASQAKVSDTELALETGSETEEEDDEEEDEDDRVPHQRAIDDAVAHFALRLAFCSTHALREWLVAKELALLTHRWERSSSRSKRRALAAAGLKPMGLGSEGLLFCSVPFTELPPHLLASRRVTLHHGMARVASVEALGALLAHSFEANLRRGMTLAAAAMPGVLEGELLMQSTIARLQDCGERLLTLYAPECEAGLAADGGGGVGLTVHNFEELLSQSFPPCMRHLVLTQRAGQHLKFLGRLQLRPFLREAGLSLAGALRWWERELCRDSSVSPEGFRGKYAYHIEYAHGKHGNGRGAFAFSCKKTIGFQQPKNMQAHGCPFRNLPPGELARLLPYWGVAADAAAGIVARSVSEGPEQACVDFFAATHPGAPPDLLNPVKHPMEFIRRSRKALQPIVAALADVAAPELGGLTGPEAVVVEGLSVVPVAFAKGIQTAQIDRSMPTPVRSGQGHSCMPARRPGQRAANCERLVRRPPVSVAKGPFLL